MYLPRNTALWRAYEKAIGFSETLISEGGIY